MTATGRLRPIPRTRGDALLRALGFRLPEGPAPGCRHHRLRAGGRRRKPEVRTERLRLGASLARRPTRPRSRSSTATAANSVALGRVDDRRDRNRRALVASERPPPTADRNPLPARAAHRRGSACGSRAISGYFDSLSLAPFDFPSLSVGDVATSKGRAELSTLIFPVELACAPGLPVTVHVCDGGWQRHGTGRLRRDRGGSHLRRGRDAEAGRGRRPDRRDRRERRDASRCSSPRRSARSSAVRRRSERSWTTTRRRSRSAT